MTVQPGAPGIGAPPPAPPLVRVRTQMSVQVLAVIEIVLGALAIGIVLQGQASAFQPELYWTIYAYASSLVLATTLVMLVLALLANWDVRAHRLLRANVAVAAAAFIMTTGTALTEQIASWSSIACDGCGPIIHPTANQVFASIVLDGAGGLFAALLPMISFILLRNRFQSACESRPAVEACSRLGRPRGHHLPGPPARVRPVSRPSDRSPSRFPTTCARSRDHCGVIPAPVNRSSQSTMLA